MRISRCLYCFAVIGMCLHTAHQPIEDDEPTAPTPFVISVPTVSTSTTSAVIGGRTFFLSTG